MKRPLGILRIKDPRISINRLMKVLSMSALRTGCLFPQGDIPSTHYCKRLSRIQVHIAAGRITTMKNPNESIGNRTRDLPDCNKMSQPSGSIIFWRLYNRCGIFI